MSLTSIDRLGQRLRTVTITDDDLRLLDEYRRSFSGAYDTVISTVDRLGYQPTGRPAKSTPSIVAKLQRETIRLTQMQDIAGCRFVVADVSQQELALTRLRESFKSIAVHDRRQNPSHG